ncbi:MAG: PAS domain S-box protein, partial [Verrucomicrobiota bacterium]
MSDPEAHAGEEHFKLLLERASTVAFVKSRAGKYLYFNHAFEQLLGRPLAELQGQTDFDLFPAEVARLLHEHDEWVLAQGKPAELVEVVPDKSGVLRKWLVNKFPVTGRDGSVVLAGVAMDITARVEAETRVQQSERKYRLLIESIPEALWIANAAGHNVYVSPTIEKLTGFSVQEIYEGGPEFWFARVDPAQMDATRAAYTAFFEQNAPYDVEYRFQRRDGRSIWLHDRAVVRFAEGGQIMAYGLVSDVTRRKEAEERLHEQAALMDKARDAICVCDLEGRLTYANRSAERLYGWIITEMIGRRAEELFGQQCIEQVRDAAAAVLRDEEWFGELRQVSREGKLLSVLSRWSLMRDAHGQPKRILIINTDISEKKKLEEQFLRAQRMENIGTLAGGVAHDLNNVLGPILMFVQLIRLQMPDPNLQRLLDSLESSAKRGASLIQQVLSFARGVETEKKVVQLRHLFHDIAVMVRNTFPANIQFETVLPRELWPVSGDPIQLYQVFLNLCVNARDAMPGGGLLRVSAENVLLEGPSLAPEIKSKIEGYIIVTVSDTGVGIPSDLLEKIFDPFFTTKEPGKGTGLGLATVNSILKNHNGFIKVSSEVGKGTQFKIYLPAIVSSETALDDDQPSRFPTGHGELVLVVDDEASIREITKATLEAFGYRVETANDGTQALARFVQRQNEVDVVITDLRMPYMDGPATIRALRQFKPNLRVIAASGYIENHDALGNSDLRISAFISKPYSAKE